MPWYDKYGKFRPGVHGYPHQGDVYANFRKKRGFKTQLALAIALGYKSAGPIEELESSMNLKSPDSIERRTLLAKFLHIPPALLALDWHFLQSGETDQESPFADIASLLQEDCYDTYEDLLTVGWETTFRGGSPQVAQRVEQRLKKLEKIAAHVHSAEQEQWLSLLCRYYLLATRLTQRYTDIRPALNYANLAVDTAEKLEDSVLKATTFFWRSRLYLDQKQYSLARDNALAALALLDDELIPDTLRGNIYLLAAEATAPYTGNDATLRDTCKRYQEKAAHITYRGNLEENDTFVKLNTATLHHEQAKTLSLMHFYRTQATREKTEKLFQPIQSEWLRAARRELTTAWKVLNPDLIVWRVNFLISEARLCEMENCLDESAQLGSDVLTLAHTLQAKDKEKQVHHLYQKLAKRDETNPYVCNLGLRLGIYA